ncbi:SET domain-containing protein [Hymenopellis radicata]|nr:SET domain-containing protein [Hymenopellis radicata]
MEDSDSARRIVEETWQDFYEWEKRDTEATIASLASPNPLSYEEMAAIDAQRKPFIYADADISAEADEDFFELQDIDGSTLTRVPIKTVVIETKLSPASPYESSPLTNRNIHRGDDSDHMQFMPFAEDPNFAHLAHAEHYEHFAWTNDFDPNTEIVVLEAARKLKELCSLSDLEIDASNLLPMKLLGDSSTGDLGVRFTSKMRDPLPWPRLAASASSPQPDERPSSLKKEFLGMASYFCSNLNCVTPCCSVHVNPNYTPREVPAKTASREFLHSSTDPCGVDCFLNHRSPTSEVVTAENAMKWSSDDLDVLKLTLDYSPDLFPCKLAEICMKPCREVFKHRADIIPDEQLPKRPSRKVTCALPKTSHLLDICGPETFIPNAPCSHDGRCADNSCPCFANGAYCEAACRCEHRPCIRRRPGCNCQRTCRTKSCRCYAAGMECDPEVCTNCEPADAVSGRCKNACIQRGVCKALEVKESKWGRGLFAAEAIKKGEFISGLLASCSLTANLTDLADHRGRSYVFQLNSEVSIDSSYICNETRYMNHSKEDANCIAEVKLVNGEQRISFHALKTIASGEELLFNYGDEFW